LTEIDPLACALKMPKYAPENLQSGDQIFPFDQHTPVCIHEGLGVYQ
jgi:hypothetical protein